MLQVDRKARLDRMQVGQKFTLYGYYLTVSNLHVERRPTRLDPLRLQGDALADAALASMLAASSKSDGAASTCPFASSRNSADILQTLRDRGDASASALLHHMEAVPSWVDWSRIERGQRMYTQNSLACGVTLMNLSLVGGFGAAHINKVLEGTGYLSSSNRDAVHRRLLETLQFIVDCMDGRECMQPWTGAGWQSCVNVRMLHAGVRHRLMNNPKKPWNTAEWGVPCNQEDTIVTQLAFSIVVLMGIERIGIAWHIDDSAMEDYLHLWRLIGHWMGIHEDHNTHMGSLTAAQSMLESLVAHVMTEPDASTRRLVLSTLRSVAYRLPLAWSMADHVAVTRAIAGDTYANSIGIPRSDDPELGELIVDHHPTTSLPSELRYVKCDNPHLAIGAVGSGAAGSSTGDTTPSSSAAAVPPSSLVVRVGSTAVRSVVWVTMRGVSTVKWAVSSLMGLAWIFDDAKVAGANRSPSEAEPGPNAASPGAGAPGYGASLLRPLHILPYLLSLPVPGLAAFLGDLQLSQMHQMLNKRLGGRTHFPLKHTLQHRHHDVNQVHHHHDGVASGSPVSDAAHAFPEPASQG